MQRPAPAAMGNTRSIFSSDTDALHYVTCDCLHAGNASPSILDAVLTRSTTPARHHNAPGELGSADRELDCLPACLLACTPSIVYVRTYGRGSCAISEDGHECAC